MKCIKLLKDGLSHKIIGTFLKGQSILFGHQYATLMLTGLDVAEAEGSNILSLTTKTWFNCG